MEPPARTVNRAIKGGVGVLIEFRYIFAFVLIFKYGNDLT